MAMLNYQRVPNQVEAELATIVWSIFFQSISKPLKNIISTWIRPALDGTQLPCAEVLLHCSGSGPASFFAIRGPQWITMGYIGFMTNITMENHHF